MFLVVCNKKRNTLTIKDLYQGDAHLESLQKVYNKIYGENNVVIKKCAMDILMQKLGKFSIKPLLGLTVNFDFSNQKVMN